MTIWQFSARVSRWLSLWAATSSLLSLPMLRGNTFWRGVGSQFIGWALINLGIAGGGSWLTRRRQNALGEKAHAPETLVKETADLRRLLIINGILDIGYMFGGLFLMLRPQSQPRMKGVGVGILLQGAFLFIFDWLNVGLLHGTNRPR
jgi:hypothetical protein